MITTRIWLRPLLLAALLMLGAGAAHAASFDHDIGGNDSSRNVQTVGMYSDQDHARKAVREGRVLSLGQVLQRVQQRVPGRLLDADLIEQGGRSIYLIKMMTRDGNVAIVSADAATGNILSVRQGGH
ncbi:MAG: PepSY domain-containing protein [Parvibaculum sp.]